MRKTRWQSFKWLFNCKSYSEQEQKKKEFKESVSNASERKEFYRLRKIHYEVGFIFSNSEHRKMYDRMRRLGIKYGLNYLIKK